MAKFKRKEKELIIIDLDFYVEKILIINKIEKKEIVCVQIPMVLDTGCTDTVLNKSFLADLFLKYENGGKTKITTGTREEKARTFKIPIVSIPSLNFELYDCKITSFDVQVEKSEYNGYLGLDFFEGKKFTIDLENNTFELH